MRTMWRGFKAILFMLLFIVPAVLIVAGGEWVIYRGPMWSKWAMLGIGSFLVLGLVSYIIGFFLEVEDL